VKTAAHRDGTPAVPADWSSPLDREQVGAGPGSRGGRSAQSPRRCPPVLCLRSPLYLFISFKQNWLQYLFVVKAIQKRGQEFHGEGDMKAGSGEGRFSPSP